MKQKARSRSWFVIQTCVSLFFRVNKGNAAQKCLPTVCCLYLRKSALIRAIRGFILLVATLASLASLAFNFFLLIPFIPSHFFCSFVWAVKIFQFQSVPYGVMLCQLTQHQIFTYFWPLQDTCKSAKMAVSRANSPKRKRRDKSPPLWVERRHLACAWFGTVSDWIELSKRTV